jgi:hypothetical protein
MRRAWTAVLLGIAGLVLHTASPSQAQRCGDLNNDGQVTIADAVVMAQCIAAGTCPGTVTPGPLCGTGNLAACGDAFGDGNTTTQLTSDLAVLVRSVAGLTVLHDLCAPIGANRPGLPGTVNVGSSTILSSQRWPSGSTVVLQGTVFVDSPASGPTTVLTIEPGVTVIGDVGAIDVPALIILPGAKVSAVGTAANPIIMTSNGSPKDANDWGGFMLNGRSTVNRPNCINQAEGLAEPYGGCDPNDSSGEVSYVRVEFAGRLFTPDNELNNFTMNGVGAETSIDHVQAHYGADDCIEWFGGTVNTHHMVASACGDDGFDWQLGWTGSLQYGLFIQSGANLTSGNNQSRGIEADNSEFGFEDLPRSNPGLCNVTLIGTGPGPLGADRGIIFRRGTAGKVGNAIVANFKNEGVNVNDSSTAAQACTGPSTVGSLLIRDSIFWNNGTGGTTHAATGAISGAVNCTTTQAWYNLLTNVVNPNGSNANNPDVSTTYPAAGQLYQTRRLSPSPFTPAAGSCTSIRDFFDDTNYAGAFNPTAACNVTTGPCDWLTRPWINFDTP